MAKAYDATRVHVGPVSRGTVGRPLQFTVDAGDAGEGNLEITISARGHNIPTQVHPQVKLSNFNQLIKILNYLKILIIDKLIIG